MHLTHLTLNHFRNYHTLEIDFSGALTILQGDNAQGKTNLLEAIYFLATSKPVHAQSEREVVGWGAADEPIPYSRIAGTVVDRIDIPADDRRPLELEIVLTPRGDGVNFKKQVRVNGVNKKKSPRNSVLFRGDFLSMIGPEKTGYLPAGILMVMSR